MSNNTLWRLHRHYSLRN